MLAPKLLTFQTSFPIGIAFCVLSLFPVTHSCPLTFFVAAILLLFFDARITWYSFTTMDANNCKGHYYNLSKSERLWILSNHIQNPEQSVQFETIYQAKMKGGIVFYRWVVSV
jgi:hypothetical protein